MASVSKHFVARHGIAVGATPTTIVDSSGNATLGTLSASSLSAALNLNSQALTNANIDSGNIDGVTIATSNVTVGAGKTLDVSAGTLTLANDQISGDKIHGGTISGPVTISTPYISTIYAQAGTGGAMTLRSNSTDITTGYISVPMTTVSSSNITGALVVGGGVGIAGSVYCGGNITAGTFYGGLSGTATAAIHISGGTAFNLPYQTAAGATTFLLPNTTTTPKFLMMTGTGAVGQAPSWEVITTLGTITSGTWNASVVTGTYGGTGVNNGTKTITLGGNLTTSGAFNTTLTATALTTVTLPTTGTLATLAGSEALTNKTVNGVTLSSLAVGCRVSGGTTAVAVSFLGGAAYTLSGTDGTTITLPATTGTVALNNQQFTLGSTAIAINGSVGTIAGMTSITSGSFIGALTGNASSATTAAACTGNAATVTTNANLTGVVTSVGNATSIADAALSIAKTSELQTALNAKQTSDPTLTALADLATGANQLPYSTGTDAFAQTPLTAFARTLLDDADQATMLTTLGSLLNGLLSKTAAYTVLAADRGKLIDATTGTWSLTIAAGVLSAGFTFAVRNSGTGVITIDPNASELIDGASTIALAAGESCLVAANAGATEWKTVGRTVSLPAATASVDGYMTSTYAGKLDGIAAGATVGVSVNAGVQGLGTMVMACANCASGLTVAGAALNVPRFDASTQVIATSFAMSTGTWKNISHWNSTTSVSAMFQRIV